MTALLRRARRHATDLRLNTAVALTHPRVDDALAFAGGAASAVAALILLAAVTG